jgi:hypothetical protein
MVPNPPAGNWQFAAVRLRRKRVKRETVCSWNRNSANGSRGLRPLCDARRQIPIQTPRKKIQQSHNDRVF